MNTAIARLAMMGLSVLATSPLRAAAQTNTLADTKAPTGVYVSTADVSPTFTMRFAADGKYRVEVSACGPWGCMSQDGTWEWNTRRQEFRLSPTRELWCFDFGCFRLDSASVDTLEWVPREGGGNVVGVYKSIKFKRQREER